MNKLFENQTQVLDIPTVEYSLFNYICLTYSKLS